MVVRGLSLTKLHIRFAAVRRSSIRESVALRVASTSVRVTVTTLLVFVLHVQREDSCNPMHSCSLTLCSFFFSLS
jgi:hypothetical protein